MALVNCVLCERIGEKISQDKSEKRVRERLGEEAGLQCIPGYWRRRANQCPPAQFLSVDMSPKMRGPSLHRACLRAQRKEHPGHQVLFTPSDPKLIQTVFPPKFTSTQNLRCDFTWKLGLYKCIQELR
jgi:hypothetical protein